MDYSQCASEAEQRNALVTAHGRPSTLADIKERCECDGKGKGKKSGDNVNERLSGFGELVESLLRVDPRDRASAGEALESAFLT